MHHPLASKPRPRTAWLLGLALLFTGLQALAQQDPPGRVAQLNFHQGTVSFSPAGDDSWYDAAPNRPLTTGDRLWTDRGARAELYIGSTAVRLDDQTELALSELSDDTARLTALQGSVAARVRDDLAGRRFEIDTGNLAVVIDAAADLRIDADPDSDITHVAVASGNATLYGEGGESLQLGGRQQLTVSGRHLAAVSGTPVQAGADAFERWVAERSRLEDQSVSARYVSREVAGYQQLDNHGDWQSDPDYGEVWYPRDVDADWAPYQDGQWVDVAPWGWTWVDAAPWGFAPFHYGRWARIGRRWCWVPGRPNARPVYAPALVGFIGGAGAALSIGGGRNGVGWFPLAPGEAWQPGFRASQRYIDEANRSLAANRQAAARNAEFANQRAPGAVTIVPLDLFGRAPITRRDILRLPDARVPAIAAATAPPVPLRGERGTGAPGRPAGALPPGIAQGRTLQSGGPPPGPLRLPPAPRPPQLQPREAMRQQQELQQQAAQMQARQMQLQQQQAQQIQLQQQQALRAQQQMQQAQQMQQLQRQNTLRLPPGLAPPQQPPQPREPQQQQQQQRRPGDTRFQNGAQGREPGGS
ncbi:DUF6600 domain-containing protein [Variovorax sp. PBL-E5]|uniref:DUF6600 domain-containing protein n=1 Tax=Variovorax sp. PBL-E5 TaxID=434014 RepID=UPI0013192A94|nr:DUF6600 domain-containing protein [Variovorax sp. PBL-E5]VTU18778.1 FecR protein [Variovorax sp. PBL-E5]